MFAVLFFAVGANKSAENSHAFALSKLRLIRV
jgi:hypothetical protein